jgi:4-amino-4-deoxy-L-arabinose transferase-like glycosyltransferase
LLPRAALALVFLGMPIGLDDMFQYDMLARSIAAGKGYRWYQRADVEVLGPYLQQVYGVHLPTDQIPVDGLVTTFRAPGYPAFLAAIYLAAGISRRLAAARLTQALLGASLAPLSALLAARLGAGRRASLTAGTIVALYPILWMYPLGLASENLFIPLAALSLLSLLSAAARPRAATSILSGVVLGLATLTRGALAPFAALAAVWLWRRAGARQAILLSLTAAAMLTPWIVRNSLVLGRPAFVENSVGYNLFVGYHPLSDGALTVAASVIPLCILDDGARDRWAMQQALGFIRADPGRAVRLLFNRLGFFWGLEDRELIYFYSNDFFGPIPQPWLALAYLVLVLPLVALALSAAAGMAWTGDRRSLTLVLALVGGALLAYVPILAEPRFHLPLVPALAAYAGVAWTTPGLPARAWAGLRRGEVAWWLAAAAAVILLVLWGWGLWREAPRLAAVMAPGGNRLGLDY